MFVWMKWPIWLKLIILLVWPILVIVMFGIFATTLLLILNPAELTMKARDVQRMADLETVSRSIKIHVTAYPTQNLTESPLCFNNSAPCEGMSAAGSIASDGTGWLPVQLSKYMAQLPVDPTNDNSYFYRFCTDGQNWELNARLENELNKIKMIDDKGDDEALYEVGSLLTVCSK